MNDKKFNERVRKEKNAYYKAWRSNNKDKVKKNNQRYWQKRTAKKMLKK